MTYSPVIVVVAFNRPRSLKRLLFSLSNLRNISGVRLIISIDNQEPDNLIIRDIAHDFKWQYGEKEVIYHKERLGLRRHILQCGDLSLTYGSVIILEDDLFVSPYFYDYAVKALQYYDNDEAIGGISLYNQPREEMSQRPFTPINDDSDVYFIQFPSSLGQAWTQTQWAAFKSWYGTNPNITNLNIPDKIYTWPETSWKKYFCSFLVKTNKFIVFPRISLTTNFNDPGTNLKLKVNHDGQAQLRIFGSDYRFKEFRNSYSIYDVYLEITPDCIRKLAPEFKEYEFEMDLYGLKNLNKVRTSYLITSRPVKQFAIGYKRALKPHEMNVIFDLRGDDIRLCRKEDIIIAEKTYDEMIAEYKFHYYKSLTGWKMLIYERCYSNFPYLSAFRKKKK